MSLFLDTRIGVDFFVLDRLSARNLWISHVVNDRFPVNFSCSFCVVSQILHECLPHFPLIFLCIVIGFSWDFHLIFFWLSLDFHRSFGGFSSDFLLTFMFGVDAGTMSLQMHTLVVWGMLYEILIPRCGLKAKQPLHSKKKWHLRKRWRLPSHIFSSYNLSQASLTSHSKYITNAMFGAKRIFEVCGNTKNI